MKINLIVARSRNGVIGVGQEIPWHITQDFRNFKKLTWGHAVVMGRKTYDSLPKVLEGRCNIVVTSTPETLQDDNITVGVKSLSDAIELCKRIPVSELWVIGGERLYEEALPIVDEMHITEVYKDIPYQLGDPVAKFIIDIDRNRWVQTRNSYCEGENISFTFNVWKRRSKPSLYENDFLLYEPEEYC